MLPPEKENCFRFYCFLNDLQDYLFNFSKGEDKGGL